MTSLLNILLVEDNADEELLICEYLRSSGGSHTLHVARTLREGLVMLERHSVDVVLLDLTLPDCSGLETFARLHFAAGTIPVVVLTGLEDEALAVRAVQAGAEDYLLKGQVHDTLLWRSLRYAVERRRAKRRIEFQAQLLDQVGQAVVACDLSHDIQYWNAAAESLFGWTRAEVAGRAMSEVVPIESPSDDVGASWASVAAGERATREVSTRRKDGTRMLTEVTLSPLSNSAGEIIGRIGIFMDVTARRAAEDALRANEQRLRIFVDAMPTVLWTTDVDLRITSIQGAGLKNVGGSVERGVGRSLTEYAAPASLAYSQRALAGESVSAAADWGEYTFDLHIEPLRDAAGAVTGTIGIALDVTERRRSERQAAEYFELLRTIIEAAPIAIIVADENARVSLWNNAAEEMFGWRSSEVVGEPMPHIPPEATAEFERARGKARQAGKALRLSARRVRKDGRTLDVVVTAAPVYGPDGRFHGTMGLLEDVTQQRHSEERQARLIAIIEASPDFVGTFDVEHRTYYVNRAGREIIGLSADQDVSGTTLEQFCTSATADLLDAEAVPRAIAEGKWSGEAWLRTVREEDVAVWLTIVAHRRADGDLAFISAVAQDISERRFLEDQLRQSQKMEAVGRLAGGVAHDFNNLLTAIAGHTELLLQDLGANADARSDIEEILRAVERASTLTRQLLAFSRRQVIQPTLLDVNQVVTDVSRLLRRLIGEDVEFVCSVGRGVPRIRADRGQIEQVIMNLVVNARDALPAGGVIELRTAAVSVSEGDPEDVRGVAPGAYVDITVIDNGTGMSTDLMSRIFEPFFTTKEQGKGTGIGLATVYGIVTQAGGHVLVDSEPGAGSTFRVLLPEVAENRDEEIPAAETLPPGHGSETILLVEDELAVRRLGRRILERKGYHVIEAESGEDAVRQFERLAPSIALLVTDVVMPGMSGGELARRLRAMKPSLHILFTSGYTADAISRQGELEAGTSFLEKPFTPDALAQKVRDVLDERGD